MPYHFVFTPDGRGLVHTGTGVVTGAEIVRCHEFRNAQITAQMPLEYGLTDFQGMTILQVDAADLGRIVAVDQRAGEILQKPITVVIVAPSDLSYGISRMWEALVDRFGWQTHVFRSRMAAIAWLQERHPGIQIEP